MQGKIRSKLARLYSELPEIERDTLDKFNAIAAIEGRMVADEVLAQMPPELQPLYESVFSVTGHFLGIECFSCEASIGSGHTRRCSTPAAQKAIAPEFDEVAFYERHVKPYHNWPTTKYWARVRFYISRQG